MQLLHELAFDPAQPEQALSQLPSSAAVYALYGREQHAEPYIGRTPDLRRRLRKLLVPSPVQSKRLQLASMVVRIAYSLTASDFESTLLLYQASISAFGDRASKRLHLRLPGFLRMSMTNDYPRLYVTASITQSTAADLFGPFPSRAAADRYAEQVLELFLLRHCYQDLAPDPAFPGCIYSEMKKCLAPCFQGCTDQRYQEEAAAVHAFLRSGGQSLLDTIARERDAASDALDFEQAASTHARYQKVEAVAALASEAAHALRDQHAIIVQPADATEEMPERVALYLLKVGTLTGPAYYSVAGMRHPNEQSGSSSLFAHPVALEAVPLEPAARPARSAQDLLDERLQQALMQLEAMEIPGTRQQLCDHLAIFARWYYRPAVKRTGEIIFLRSEGGTPPAKLVLRAISRVYRAQLAASK